MASLVKSSWQFLYQHKLYLEHGIILQPPRLHNLPIMPMIPGEEFSTEELLSTKRSINRCRLF